MKNILFIAMTLLLLLSCSEKKKTYRIAMSQCSDDTWRDKLNTELRTGTYLYDNLKLEIASADDNDKKQVEQINKFIDSGIDLLIVSPNQINALTPTIEKAYDKGIPVILIDRKSGSEKYTAFIGADNVKLGRTMGEYVATQLNGKGRVAEIMGLKGSSPAIERHKGFAEALSRYPGITLVASRNGNWTRNSGAQVMESFVKDGLTDLDYVFVQNDRMATGAYSVAKKHGLNKRVKFVGVDALATKGGGMELVRDGVLTASYIYPTRGDLVLQLAMNILEGRPYKRVNWMKTALVTKSNAQEMLLQAEELNRHTEHLNDMHKKVDMYFTQYSHQKVYLTLICIIMVLLVLIFVAVYRTVLVKRRMTEEAANAKLVFFTNISHEFRTPLTLIADPVRRILEDDNLTPQQRQMLGIVKKNTDVMLRLVGEILDLRKIQNGKMLMDVSRFDLAQCVSRWTENFRPLCDGRGLKLDFKATGEVTVEADMHKIERICYNLIINAVKYNRKGGTIDVSVGSDATNALITVADTGVGIPKDKAQHVFDRFFQAGNAEAGGTGIGLALVKAFAELHGGTVTVDANGEQGAVFTVTLPLTQPQHEVKDVPDDDAPNLNYAADDEMPADTEQTMTADLTADADTADGRKMVLVVDDNADVRAYIVSLLGKEYDVRCAADGQEGLKACMKDVPDIVICDVMMPVMDGLEMCRRVKQETITSHIPVILLTARTFEDQRAEGYDCGADAYITKPFNSKVLLARVRNLLNERKRLKYIYSGSDEEETRQPDTDTQFIADFRRTVQESIGDSELNVEAVAAQMGLSRVQLYRKVKSLTGSSPVEIIRITRLKQAERMLKTTRKTVSEISYAVGFSSPSYFAKCFKEQFGHLPNDVREGME